MPLRNRKAGTALGLVSLLLFLLVPVYIYAPERFPEHALTESAVIFGGVGGSLLTAVSAGLIGSRWWFLMILGSALDVLLLWGFSP